MIDLTFRSMRLPAAAAGFACRGLLVAAALFAGPQPARAAVVPAVLIVDALFNLTPPGRISANQLGSYRLDAGSSGTVQADALGQPEPTLRSLADIGPDPFGTNLFGRGSASLNYGLEILGPAGSVSVLVGVRGQATGTATGGASFAVESLWRLEDGANVLASDDIRSGQIFGGSFDQGFDRTIELLLQSNHLYSFTMGSDAAAGAPDLSSHAVASAFVDPVFTLGAGVDPALYSFQLSDGIGNGGPLAVPAPATLGLLAIGLVMLIVQRAARLARAWPLVLVAGLASLSGARADVVVDWNARATELIAASGLGTPPASRTLAIVHTAAFEAANAITRRYPSAGRLRIEAPPSASVEAAIAAAHRIALSQLLPQQQPAIESAWRSASSAIADGAAKEAGIAVGERAAREVLALSAADGAAARESYRPYTTAGRYVPTTLPAALSWPQRKPWLMASAPQFRPGPPPALSSERWARDYNEIKAIGGQTSAVRSAEQTDIARFWTATGPSIYQGLVRSVAQQPGRDLMRNARLFAAVSQAIDDALIAVFDAKYHHAFWRPITAIRNGDLDGNDATERDATWTPFIDTPMHPEYPCAHCIQAAAVHAILRAEMNARAGASSSAEAGTRPQPQLSTASPTANGAVRRWSSVHALVQEVGNARIYDGVHYRFSTEVGADVGRRIGELAVQRFLGE